MSRRGKTAFAAVVVLLCAALALFLSSRPKNFWQVFHTETYEITRADGWLCPIEGGNWQVTLTKGDPALDELIYFLTDQSYRPDPFHGGGGSLEMDPYVYLSLYTEDGSPPRTLGLFGEQTIEIDGKRYVPSHAIAGQAAIRDLLLELEPDYVPGD